MRILLFALCSFASPAAFAWAGLGHRIVAENAALLVRADQPAWGDFLARHRFELGVYALDPDDLYRSIDGQKGAIEAPTHFFMIDIAGPKPPVDRAAAEAALQKGGHSLGEVGSSPWRIEQFEKRAQTLLAAAKPEHGGYQPGRGAGPGTRALFEGLYALGILAHYAGDALVPYHATHDKNGWDAGLGGNHWFFEATCLDALEPELGPLALASAKKNQKAWLAAWHEKDPVPLSFAVYNDTLASLAVANRIDAEKIVTQKSIGTQTPAVRKPAAESCPAFRELLVERLAKAAVFTAALWEAALPAKVPAGLETIQFSDLWRDPSYPTP